MGTRNECPKIDVYSGLLGFKASLHWTTSKGQTLIVTENEKLGLARAPVAPGDQVCVLLGCSVPNVLRQLPGSKEYQLIGELHS